MSMTPGLWSPLVTKGTCGLKPYGFFRPSDCCFKTMVGAENPSEVGNWQLRSLPSKILLFVMKKGVPGSTNTYLLLSGELTLLSPSHSQNHGLPLPPPSAHLAQSFNDVQFSSVAQLCLTLCDPTDCSAPGLPVLHQLPELAQTHVHPVDDAIQLSHLQSSPSPPAFNLSQHHGHFQ